MASFLDMSDFENFKKKNEVQAEKKDFAPKWPTKAMQGTADEPKTYEFRFLPDLKGGNLYKHYFYHMINLNDKWNYMVCPKTFDASNYCPICAAVNKLYKGNEEDKKEAYKWKRKERFVSNVKVVDDPRDAAISDDSKKSVGKVLIFEFPAEIEKVLKQELNDPKRGLGRLCFEPGEAGHNFVLNVGAKPGDKPGSTWPTYNLQAARNPSPVGDSKEEILGILEQTHNLDEFIQSSVMSEEFMVKLLKDGLLYNFIKAEYEARTGVVTEDTPAPMREVKKEEPTPPFEPDARTVVTPKKAAAKKEEVEIKKGIPSGPAMSEEDAELLASLDDLK